VSTYKIPRLRLPAMIIFSRRGAFNFQMNIHGRIAKKMSTPIVPTEVTELAHPLFVAQIRNANLLARIMDKGTVLIQVPPSIRSSQVYAKGRHAAQVNMAATRSESEDQLASLSNIIEVVQVTYRRQWSS
jgi:hypothetical protein